MFHKDVFLWDANLAAVLIHLLWEPEVILPWEKLMAI